MAVTLTYKHKFVYAYFWLKAVIAVIAVFIRELFRKDGAPRPGTVSITTAFMEGILRKNNVISTDVKVTKAEIKTLQGNRGYAGNMNKIHVTFSSGKTDTYIIKMTQSAFSNRLYVLFSKMYREGAFYGSSYAKAIIKNSSTANDATSNLPAIYYTYSSSLYAEFVIIMEDLSTTNSVGINKVMGNQIWGNAEYEPIRDKATVLQQMYISAADMHAIYWNDKSLLSTKWLKGANWYNKESSIDKLQWELAIEKARNCWVIAKQIHANPKHKVTFDQKFIDIVDKSLAKSNYDEMVKYLTSPKTPFTLCHGDFHAANMFLVRDNNDVDTVVMLDWSEFGPYEPTTDLAQTVISDIRPDVFIPIAKDSLRKYYDHLTIKLIEHGKYKDADSFQKQYPFEDWCWKSYCNGGIEKWLWMFPLMCSLGVPDACIQYFHDQMLAFIQAFTPDQDSFTLKTVCLLPH